MVVGTWVGELGGGGLWGGVTDLGGRVSVLFAGRGGLWGVGGLLGGGGQGGGGGGGCRSGGVSSICREKERALGWWGGCSGVVGGGSDLGWGVGWRGEGVCSERQVFMAMPAPFISSQQLRCLDREIEKPKPRLEVEKKPKPRRSI